MEVNSYFPKESNLPFTEGNRCKMKEIPPDCGGPFPRECDYVLAMALRNTIIDLEDNPILIIPIEEREAEIKYLEHQLLSIVQSKIIDKITEDSIEQVLVYLDSIKSFSPMLEDIYDVLLEKYTEPLLRPSPTNDYTYYHNLRAFVPEITSTSEFVPLIKQVGNLHKPTNEKDKDVEEMTIQIFPNPTNGQTIIRLLNGEKEDIGLKKISMYNAIGQQVLSADPINSQSYQFDVISYDTGLYFIQVQDSNNQSHVKKLIIQN